MIDSVRDLRNSTRDAVPCGRCGVPVEPPRNVVERGRGSRVVYVVVCAICEDAFIKGAWGQAELNKCSYWTFRAKRKRREP